jgi:sulfoxide reductase catalytic subunit YedY
MAKIRIARGWEIPDSRLTPEPVYLNRREVLKTLGFAGLGALAAAAGCSPERVGAEGEARGDGPWRPVGIPEGNPNAALYPPARNAMYVLDRGLTAERPTATYNNYYEFTTVKEQVWRLAEHFRTRPWQVRIEGLCDRPGTFEVDDLVQEFGIEERTYRHRCVEAWAMAVPWAGFPFAKLVEKVGVRNDATHVAFVSFLDPENAVGQKTQHWYPWPYYEALTMAEAMNELTFVATGIYGHELPRQNGAPWRMVVPWKYGYKSPKAMVGVRFTSVQPGTFWSDLQPDEYPFTSNVDPDVPHPRWSQKKERLIDTGEMVPTQRFNGYGEFVAQLYG